MPTTVHSLLVLVASPGDALEERAAVRDKLNDWNVTTGLRQGVVSLPWLYERHAVAQMGGRAQALINSQALDRADVVVAFFDSRLGTQTGTDVSGTAEEIRRAHEQGKPVHVYFSTESIPRDSDLDQLTALTEFKQQLEADGLLGDYADPGDLAAQIARALEADIDDRGWGEGLTASSKTGARLTWEHVHEKEQVGVDSKGKIKTRTRHNHLEVRNLSGTDAEDLTFNISDADDPESQAFRFEGPAGPVTIHAESARRWGLIPLKNTTLKIEAKWMESGKPKARTFTVVTR
ncbi:hypothetical protein LWF01_13420 [Saxibacter everestensis]|uniref:DUF4062 domain-containing protein n=1 Tax=Saxibacter everestensis TaxID=2909229 RepID=A0ABY8QSF1_9MICO|nr:hypothetical protein LWF01_13420 [Brevibacteriaceae bacterium ZFBP1038]